MPGAYPPAAPTLAGDLLTIHRLLQNPTYLRRRLRTIAELRFVADRILTGRFRTSGGAIAFEQSEPIMNSRPVEAVAPGGEYPRDSTPEGTAALAAVSKWGQAVPLTDEKLKRSVYMGQELNRALIKTANTVISKVDRLATSAVASAVTNSIAASAAWNAASPMLFRDVELAAAKIVDLNQGYNPRAVLMSTTKYALLITDPAIAALRRREASDNPIYGGDIDRLGKYEIVTTAVANLPSDDVWVYDPDQLGGMADETEVDPGYATLPNNLQYKTKRIDERDSWDIWARRITVPVVQEPGAAIRLTGTGSLG
ncbi:hypothetical protein [Micromonospora costi]|uniref:Major capsid protein n=1 Tax=Micromonospora costi TaxID=1530042 RepID=A0A3B0A6K3_9ACTN|nr:hypothetical protein [Micromonospora costi]RKN55940.1 hypothetical protein D7193_15250 [Micromonospora costi]